MFTSKDLMRSERTHPLADDRHTSARHAQYIHMPSECEVPGAVRSVSDSHIVFTASASTSDVAHRQQPQHFYSPREMRRALRGKWLYALGDSSLRGLYLSLYQQLIEPADGVFRFETYIGGNKSYPQIRYLMWHDVIINARNGQLLGLQAFHEKPDRSWPSLSHLWCHGRVAHAAWTHAANRTASEFRFLKTHRRPCDRRPSSTSETPCDPAHRRDAIRLTFQMSAYVTDLAKGADSFDELATCFAFEAADCVRLGHGKARCANQTIRITSRPDVHVLEAGAWDDQVGTSWPTLEAHFLFALRRWREAAGESNAVTTTTTTPSTTTTTRVFVTSPTHLRLFAYRMDLRTKNALPDPSVLPGPHNCSIPACLREKMLSNHGPRHGYKDGGWEEAVFSGKCGDEYHEATRGVHLVNRQATASMLWAGVGERCECLDALTRERTWRESMRFHAPHLHNLWDAQLLLGAVVGGGASPEEGSKEGSKESSEQRTLALHLAHNWTRDCCCNPPPKETGAAGSWTVNMWARMCKVAEPLH